MTAPLAPASFALSRRRFLSGLGLAAGAMALPGNVGMAFGQTSNTNILVVLYQRGGCDGLSLVAPVNDADYIAARPTLKVESSGSNAGLALGRSFGTTEMRLHPAATGLFELWQTGALAIVHATGLLSSNRSHFKSIDMLERAVADSENSQSTGWLTRTMTAIGATQTFGTLAGTSALPHSFAGASSPLAVKDYSTFALRNETANRTVLQTIFGTDTPYGVVGTGLLGALQTVNTLYPVGSNGQRTAYTPAAGVDYGTSDVGLGLKTIAQTIKMNVGLKLATVEQQGWDTHDSQPTRFQTLASNLGQALKAFWQDLGADQARVSVVVLTEFGRRVKENQNSGTDHGHGAVAMALGAGVKGGLYGTWPGLNSRNLDQGLDLMITTDYRQILWEVVNRRLGVSTPASIFPTLTAAPLGLMA